MRKRTVSPLHPRAGRFPDPWDASTFGWGSGNAHWQPLVDVVASSELASICLDLAGVAEDEITVSVTGHVVRVAGHRPLPDSTSRPPGVGYVRAEILYGAFERTIELPWEVDPARTEIAYRNGLLVVQVHRRSSSDE